MLLQVAAGALLSQAESRRSSAEDGETLGIDTFDVRAGQRRNPHQHPVVSVGSGCPPRATLSYEQSLDGLARWWKCSISCRRHVRLEAQGGQPSSFDAFYTREYD